MTESSITNDFKQKRQNTNPKNSCKRKNRPEAFASGLAVFNFNYLFYSCTNLASVNGLGNLSGVRSMRYTFSSCAVAPVYSAPSAAKPRGMKSSSR